MLCEKPLALRVKQADEMLAAAGQAGRIVPVNYVLRYNPGTYLRDRNHRRIITESNGRDAVAMAQRAAELAAGKEFIDVAA